MTSDQLEFAISQYLDGTLPSQESAALEEVLATDAKAREVFAEYQRLDSVVKIAMPMPEIAWEGFSQRVAQATSEADAPVKTYRLPLAWIGSMVALAASIAIAFGIFFHRPPTTSTNHPVEIAKVTPTPHGSISVTGPMIEAASRPAVAQVTVSAPTSMARANNWRYAEEIVTRPSRVIIASSAESAQDNASLPF